MTHGLLIFCAIALFAIAPVVHASSPSSPSSTNEGVIRPGQAWFDTDGKRIYAGRRNRHAHVYIVRNVRPTLRSTCSLIPLNMYVHIGGAGMYFENDAYWMVGEGEKMDNTGE